MAKFGLGCLTFMALISPSARSADAIPMPPAEARDHTYFLVINGADPLFIGKLDCLCESIRCSGYKNVELYKLIHGCNTEGRICQIRKCDPAAKIVLIGYSLGANTANKVCHKLDCQRVFVDGLVYIGGDCLKDCTAPKNVGRVLNINSEGLIFKGVAVEGAANYQICARHLQLPTRPETLGLILSTTAEMHVETKTASK